MKYDFQDDPDGGGIICCLLVFVMLCTLGFIAWMLVMWTYMGNS